MSLIGLLVAVIIIGLLFWLIGQLPITPPWLKSVAYVILVIIAIVWLLGGLPEIS